MNPSTDAPISLMSGMTCPVTPTIYTTRMTIKPVRASSQVFESEWLAFPGGELEGARPSALCPSCRAELSRAATTASPVFRTSPRPLCFQCYRATLERDRALMAAGELDTSTPERFQFALPLEPVNRARLERLRVERAHSRAAAQAGAGRYVDKRRHAQIAARHMLQRLIEGLRARDVASADRNRVVSDALHAAELQLPESWLPFVGSREAS